MADPSLDETFVIYQEIIERLTVIDRSMVEAGIWLPALSFGIVLLGAGVRRWNLNRASWEV